MEIPYSQYNVYEDAWESMLKMKNFSLFMLQIQCTFKQTHQSLIDEHGLLTPCLKQNYSLTTIHPIVCQELSTSSSLSIQKLSNASPSSSAKASPQMRHEGIFI